MGVRFGGYGGGMRVETADAGGMVTCRGRASGAFLCLGTGSAMLGGSRSGSCSRTKCLMATPRASSLGSDINEVGSDTGGNGDVVEEELEGGIATT